MKPISVQVLRTLGPAAYIVALANSFPCLEHKMDGLEMTAATWDVDRFMEAALPWSHGERCAALFIANVWNPGYANGRGWIFDVFEAFGVWGVENRQAFIMWSVDPVWP